MDVIKRPARVGSLCTKCQDPTKPRVFGNGFFARDGKSGNGLRPVCKICDAARKRGYRDNPPPRRPPPKPRVVVEDDFDIDVVDVEADTQPSEFMRTANRVGRTHAVIPDVQNRPGVPTEHLEWIGRYLAEKRPSVIVCLGDFSDMVSLNSYAVGKAEAEGTRYRDDIDCARRAMDKLLDPIRRVPGYNPELVMTMGNHEDRISREAACNARLIGTIGVDDLEYKEAGWRVYPFLEVATIDGIEYVHYVTTGVMGRPASSAAAMLRQRQKSVVQGHVQRLDIAVHPFTQNIAIMAGIAYLHDEKYLGPQGNNTKRGIFVLNEVRNGTFDPMYVSLGYLRRRLGQ